MKGSRTPPTTEGWFWFLDDKRKNPEVVCVALVSYTHTSTGKPPPPLMVRRVRSNPHGWILPSLLNGVWLGEIQPPITPPRKDAAGCYIPVEYLEDDPPLFI